MESRNESNALRLASRIMSQTEKLFDGIGKPTLIEVDILKQSLRELYVIVDEAIIGFEAGANNGNENFSIEMEDIKPTVTEVFDGGFIQEANEVENPKEDVKPKQTKSPQKLKLRFVEPEIFDSIHEEPKVEAVEEISETIISEISDEAVVEKEVAKIEENIVEAEIPVIEPGKPEIVFTQATGKTEVEPNIIEQAPKVVEVIKDTKPSNTEAKKSIHDMTSQKTGEMTLADKMNQKSINSLKASIGINDKFQFINELFDGKMKDFNLAVEEIDKLSNFREALDFISTFSKANSWNEESPVVEQFMSYLNRRFRQ